VKEGTLNPEQARNEVLNLLHLHHPLHEERNIPEPSVALRDCIHLRLVGAEDLAPVNEDELPFRFSQEPRALPLVRLEFFLQEVLHHPCLRLCFHGSSAPPRVQRDGWSLLPESPRRRGHRERRTGSTRAESTSAWTGVRHALRSCVLILLAGLSGCADAPKEGSTAPTLARGSAGASAVPITPSLDAGAPPVWIAGYGKGRRAPGVHDDLFARAFVWDDGERRIALVSLDLVGLFRDRVLAIRDRVSARADLGVGAVLVASTHNHEGPDTMGIWGPDPMTTGAEPRYLDLVEDRAVEAIARAVGALAPATLHAGEIVTEGLVEDSRPPIVKDEVVRVLEARASPGGRTIATLFVFSSHPESLGPDNTLLTADYPAFAIRDLERARGGTAIFFPGSIGGLLGPGDLRLPDPETGEPAPLHSFRNAELYGARLAEYAERALASARPLEGVAARFDSMDVRVPVENPLFLLAGRLGVAARRDLLVEGRPAEDPADIAGDRVEIPTEVGRLRIGDLEWLLVPGEIYPELVFGGIAAEDDPGADFPDAPAEAPLWPLLLGRHRAVVGLANDEIGYLLPRRQWDARPPYRFGRKTPPYGEINSCGPSAGPRIVEAAAALLRTP